MPSFTASPVALSPEEKLEVFEFPPSSTSTITEDTVATTSNASVKKARRQTAFYPNMNSSNRLQKPFSRSAAKRESVMALGSIEHLQHYFTKTGLAAKRDALKESKGLVPAIGGPNNRPLRPSLGSIQEFHLPPSPAIPVFNRPQYPPVEKTYEVDPEIIKPGVIKDLEAVAECWGFSRDPAVNTKPEDNFDVLTSLRLTTQLIRSVRNYCLSLPDESIAAQLHKTHFQPGNLKPNPKKRLVSNPNSDTDPLSRIRRSALETLTSLRALEERARLPLSDEAYDAQSDRLSSQDSRSPEPIITVLDDDENGYSTRHSPAQGHDVSFAISVVSVPGRDEAVPVWDDDEDIFDNVDDEKREVWDERLVLGGGWLYRQDIKLSDLSPECSIVSQYLDSVDEALFDGPSKDGTRGWEREAAERARAEREGKAKGRRSSLGKRRDEMSPERNDRRVVSTGILETMNNMSIAEEPEPMYHSEGEDSISDNELPDWAKRYSFGEDPLGRAHALLTVLLPNSLLPLLPSPYTSRVQLLTALSSGQLLCNAYNVGIRRSRKMWGYINKDAIHDIASLEARIEEDDDDEEARKKRKTGWTFRRTDNLRLWAGALKLRYNIPLTTPMSLPTLPSLPSLTLTSSDSSSLGRPKTPTTGPNSPNRSPSPARTKFIAGTGEVPLIEFDAKLVARRDPGWDNMLETVLHCWVRAVVDEKRGSR